MTHAERSIDATDQARSALSSPIARPSLFVHPRRTVVVMPSQGKHSAVMTVRGCRREEWW